MSRVTDSVLDLGSLPLWFSMRHAGCSATTPFNEGVHGDPSRPKSHQRRRPGRSKPYSVDLR